jgi:hypothetical protein
MFIYFHFNYREGDVLNEKQYEFANLKKKSKPKKKNDNKNKKCSYCIIAKSIGLKSCSRCSKKTGV